MNALLIEDDINKRSSISAVLARDRPDLVLTTRAARQSGLRSAVVESFDVLLLDMSLPLFEVTTSEPGYEFRHFAGLEIMEELVRHGKSTPTIVITQFEVFGEGETRMTFDELVSELRKRFGEMFLGAVFYSAEKSTWERQLIDLLGTRPSSA